MEFSIAVEELDSLVQASQQSNREALNRLLHHLQKPIYAIALRFLSQPHDAQDACQEISIRIARSIDSFKGDSQFSTWVYRIAVNTLISYKTKLRSNSSMSFDEFGSSLHTGMGDQQGAEQHEPEHQRLLQEIRVACTLAMLQCLDDDSRMAYILGDILEMDHSEGSQILNISSDNYRKRLSRARSSVIQFMSDNCGLMNQSNPCRCNRQVNKCLTKGCVSREHLAFSRDDQQARSFPAALKLIRTLHETQRAAALFRQIPDMQDNGEYAQWVRNALEDTKISFEVAS